MGDAKHRVPTPVLLQAYNGVCRNGNGVCRAMSAAQFKAAMKFNGVGTMFFVAGAWAAPPIIPCPSSLSSMVS
jgi:hypothetical protein